jgi:holo-[acyl-carrier protein] synthase
VPQPLPAEPEALDRGLTFRVGVDAIHADRLERVMAGDDSRLRSVFTERELAHCSGRRREYDHLAARFAAKEAVLKAFGTGIARRMRFTDGRPRIVLDGAAATFAERRHLRQLDISLSHSDGFAVATAITVWDSEG